MNTSSDRLHAIGVGLLLAFGAFAIGQLVVAITVVGFVSIGINVANRPGILLAISVVMLQGVTFGGVALAYLRYRHLSFDFIHVRIPSLRDLGMVAVGFGAIFGVLQMISRVLARFGLESAQNSIVDIAGQNPTIFLLLIPLSFILIGPGEELLYRGLIQGILRKSFSPVRAIILASLLFAAIHIFSLQGQLQGKLVYLGVVFALALVLGSLYEYTENLAVPALVHGAYNATLFGVQYLVATGMISQ